MDVQALLPAYGELAVRVGLNLQPGQRLLIIGPTVTGGASLEAAPLVREIAASAYRAGAPLVETLWGDEAIQLLRLQHAPRDSFGQFSAWLPDALVDHVEAGHAVLSVYANNPDLMKDAPPQLIGEMQTARVHRLASVPRTDRAQSDELDRGRRGERGLGRESLPGAARRISKLATSVGRDRASVPPRSPPARSPRGNSISLSSRRGETI